MDNKDITSLLERLRNEDETELLNNIKTVLDYYYKSVENKEIILKEFNRLVKKINESAGRRKIIVGKQ